MTQQSMESFKAAVRVSVADISSEELMKGVIPKQKERVIIRLKAGADYFKRIYSRLVKSNGENTHFDADRETMVTEMNFFRDRDADTQEAAERLIACDLIVIDDYPLERLLRATDEKTNNELYDELSTLENIRNSQLLTLSFNSGLPFENQTGPVRLALAKFLLIKARLCYTKKDIKLNKKNYENHYLDHTDIRLDDIRRRMHQLFNEARAVGEHNQEAFEAFKADLASLTTETKESVKLPDKAPEIYKERADRKEDPEAFTRRVYEPWLGKGLLRPHIKQLDKPLYQALYKKGFPSDFDTLLPTAQGRSAQLLVRTDEERLVARLDSQRRADNKRGRTPNKILQ